MYPDTLRQLGGAAGYGQAQTTAPPPLTKQETLQEIQRQALELLSSARGIIATIHESIHGPMPENAAKEGLMLTGSMAVALELRNQARLLCDQLEGIRSSL